MEKIDAFNSTLLVHLRSIHLISTLLMVFLNAQKLDFSKEEL